MTFFPQLIAGPIVHHHEIIPQLGRLAEKVRSRTYIPRFIVPGITLLTIGLVKKVVIADTFGFFADPTFNSANIGRIGFLDAWGGALSYTLQIYFDFSAYSDMAIGLGMLFGLVLPVNFLSPYKSASIIDFWRRWHITLSRFLRDYLYFPLGGNRKGKFRRHVNLMATMLLGGLWHGANWTFVFWGGMHGAFLVINHLLRKTVTWHPPRWLGVSLTFLCVVFSWVAFRAESLSDTLTFYHVMFGGRGVVIPWGYSFVTDLMGPLAEVFSIRPGDVIFFGGMRQIAAIGAGLLLVFFAPSSMTIMEHSWRRRVVLSQWMPIALGGGAALALLIMWAQTNVRFLYFQF